jgi:eukaryotic translation initiation factor 2C
MMEPENFRIRNRDTDDAKYNFPSDLPLRPGVNSTGKAIQIRVNQYKVNRWPDRDVYQYDVSLNVTFFSNHFKLTIPQINIGNGAEKKGKIMAVWMSQAVQNRLRQISPGASLLWDRNKLLWYFWDTHWPLNTLLTSPRSTTQFQEQRIMVDLDQEKGRAPRNPPDTVYCVIRPAKIIRMAVIQAYLSRQMPFDNSILEAISKSSNNSLEIMTYSLQASLIMLCANGPLNSTPWSSEASSARAIPSPRLTMLFLLWRAFTRQSAFAMWVSTFQPAKSIADHT